MRVAMFVLKKLMAYSIIVVISILCFSILGLMILSANPISSDAGKLYLGNTTAFEFTFNEPKIFTGPFFTQKTTLVLTCDKGSLGEIHIFAWNPRIITLVNQTINNGTHIIEISNVSSFDRVAGEIIPSHQCSRVKISMIKEYDFKLYLTLFTTLILLIIFSLLSFFKTRSFSFDRI